MNGSLMSGPYWLVGAVNGSVRHFMVTAKHQKDAEERVRKDLVDTDHTLIFSVPLGKYLQEVEQSGAVEILQT